MAKLERSRSIGRFQKALDHLSKLFAREADHAASF